MQLKTFTHQQADPAQARPGGFSFFKKLGALALVLVGVSASRQAWGQTAAINDDAISLSYQPTNGSMPTNQTFAGANNDAPYTNYTRLGRSNKATPTPPALGTYDLNGNSAITLTGAMLQGAVTTNNTSVTESRLQYRIYLRGTASVNIPNYSNLTLTTTQNSTSTFSPFSATGAANINLLTGLTSGGTYIIDVRFQADISNNQGDSDVATDPQGGAYYYATFDVTAPATTPPGGTTTWQGVARGTSTGGGNPMATAADTDWNNSANWTNGVPTALSNAIIPATGNNSNIVYPILNNPASGTTTTAAYRVNNLTLQGTQNSTGAKLTINTTVLRVYGDIRQPAGGMTGNITNNAGVTDTLNNSTLVLAGADQVITGSLVVSDIIVAGSGTKSVINQVTPTNIITFQPKSVTAGVIIQSASQDVNNGAVTTNFDTTGNSYVQLVSSSTISIVVGQAETIYSYIKGVVRADRQVTANQQNTFGNIGLDITANHTPGNIVVYRVVGDALNSPPNSTAKPIKRQYKIVGDDNSSNNAFANSTLDVVFHYLDSDGTTSANELNGIMEQNLTMFRTQTNGSPYTALNGILNTANNTVTRLAINSLSNFTLTLGDITNPLPITLAAFAAVRNGNNALVTWTTATEENNQGFNVQVSVDGVKFRTLGFVESKVTNSVQAQNYSYTDVEAGKTGTRYYRLEQVDVNGTKSYSPVKAVSFSGAAATSLSLSASPNTYADQLALSFDGPSVADGMVHVKIMDMTGRIVRDQNLTMSGASIALGNLSELRSGLYIAKVTLVDGTTKTVRIQRQ